MTELTPDNELGESRGRSPAKADARQLVRTRLHPGHARNIDSDSLTRLQEQPDNRRVQNGKVCSVESATLTASIAPGSARRRDANTEPGRRRE